MRAARLRRRRRGRRPQIAEERELREKAQLELKNRMHEGERNAQLKAALAAERGALEAEKAKVEAEIEDSRRRAAPERRRSRAEEAIRQEETVARLKLESEHNAKVSRLAVEIDRLKEELQQSTNAMGNEMMRWKSQADAAANAVSLAKDEVMERKKELDNTKEKMDHLVEKLYIGREKGLELRGAGTSTSSATAPTSARARAASRRPESPGRGKPVAKRRRDLRARAPKRAVAARRARRQDGHRRARVSQTTCTARATSTALAVARPRAAATPWRAARVALKIYAAKRTSAAVRSEGRRSTRRPNPRREVKVRCVHTRRASRAAITNAFFMRKRARQSMCTLRSASNVSELSSSLPPDQTPLSSPRDVQMRRSIEKRPIDRDVRRFPRRGASRGGIRARRRRSRAIRRSASGTMAPEPAEARDPGPVPVPLRVRGSFSNGVTPWLRGPVIPELARRVVDRARRSGRTWGSAV